MTDETWEIPCSECPYARDWSITERANAATIWWHKGWADEKYVCKRCYQRMYMRARRGSPTEEFAGY